MKTARFLAMQVQKLHEAGIRVFYHTRGTTTHFLELLANSFIQKTVKVFGGQAEAVAIDRPSNEIPVVVHGLSFAEPRAPGSLIHKYKPPVEGAVNIGMMHTKPGCASGHDPYAPCSLDNLRAKNFQYWALGHIHKRSVMEGDCAIVCPAHLKDVILTSRESNPSHWLRYPTMVPFRFEERITSVAQFERIQVDVTGIDDWRDMVKVLGQELDGDVTAHRSNIL